MTPQMELQMGPANHLAKWLANCLTGHFAK